MKPVWKGTCPGCRAETTTRGAVDTNKGGHTRVFTMDCPNCDHEMEMVDQAPEPRRVTPPRNFSPPHPTQTCPCDTCSTLRQFQKTAPTDRSGA